MNLKFLVSVCVAGVFAGNSAHGYDTGINYSKGDRSVKINAPELTTEYSHAEYAEPEELKSEQEIPDEFRSVKEQVIIKRDPDVKKPKLKDDEIFLAVEQPAMFPGGPAALNKWLSSNMIYPPAAEENNIQGRVIVKFVVGKDGSISQPQVAKGVDRDLDKEALRIVNLMPKWLPGKNNGEPVSSWFTLPVVFKLKK